MIEQTLAAVATGFGLGLMPWAPGTFGSLLGLPLAWWLLSCSPIRQVVILAVLLALGVPLCHWTSLWLGGGDVPSIVADEYLAFPISALGFVRTPWILCVAFLLFRLFDATKLTPIDQFEAIGGGAGIVADDVMAALYAWISLAIGVALWRRWHSI